MAIETKPDTAPRPGGQEPAGPRASRPWWMRPAIHTAIIGAVLGYVIGHWLGNFLASSYQQNRAALALVPRAQPERLSHGRRRARHHDDDDDDVNHPGAVRQLLRAPDDRRQASGLPAHRGPLVLAHPGRVPRPALRGPARRVPDRLDRL